jgi:Big-like domain-containing protein
MARGKSGDEGGDESGSAKAARPIHLTWYEILRVLALLIILLLAWWIGGIWFYRRYIAALYIGALVGASELVARYRDAPERALWTVPATLYVLINAVASTTAMYVVTRFGIVKGETSERIIVTQIFLAGFGAMAFFRTSIFTYRVGDQDIGIGPVAFLQVILKASDRAVDRLRANERAAAVDKSMAGVSFNRAQAALTTFCLALMQNVPPDEQKTVSDSVNSLKASTVLDDDTKAKSLGLALMNVVGDKVLATAVERLRTQIQKTSAIVIGNLPPSLTVGQTADITALCKDAKGKDLDGRQVTWASDETAVATISAMGHVTAVKEGTTLIRATSDDIEARTPLTVTSATIAPPASSGPAAPVGPIPSAPP